MHKKTERNGTDRQEVVHLVDIILAFRICSSQYSTASVELADKACLGNTDSLLFHSFMNTRPVMLTYTVEFINATQATVSKDQGTGFKLPFTAVLYTTTQANYHYSTQY